MSEYVVHFTKVSEDGSAYDQLTAILASGHCEQPEASAPPGRWAGPCTLSAQCAGITDDAAAPDLIRKLLGVES